MAAKKSTTEILSILGEWKRLRQEGVTQKQFAQERGLSVRTLRDWERRFTCEPTNGPELVAQAKTLIDELTRLVASMEPPVVVAPAPVKAPYRRFHGGSRPDMLLLF